MPCTNPLLLRSDYATGSGTIEQFHLLDQLNAISRWIFNYEKANGIHTGGNPIAFSNEGYCLGLSMLALTSVAISQNISRKVATDQSYTPQPDANTIENFYEMLDSISVAKIPEDYIPDEAKKGFYTKMSAVLQCIEGAHRGGHTSMDMFKTSDDQPAKQIVNYREMYKDFGYPNLLTSNPEIATMNYIGPEGCRVILRNSYEFVDRSQEQLLDVLQYAQNGDMFYVTLSPRWHAVAIYCMDDTLTLYNPNCDNALSVAQKELNKSVFDIGGVFYSLSARHAKGVINQDMQYNKITCSHITTLNVLYQEYLNANDEDSGRILDSLPIETLNTLIGALDDHNYDQ